MPTYGEPARFHCEHTVIRREGNWLIGHALGVCYRWPLTGFIANGQLVLVFSDASDFVIRPFNRADQPIIDAVDGLMLGAASLPHQAPTASRVVMHRLLDGSAGGEEVAAMLESRRSWRAFYAVDELPEDVADALGSAAHGADSLLRADTTGAQVRTRWF